MVRHIGRKNVVVVTGNVQKRKHSLCVRSGSCAGKSQRERARTIEGSYLIGQLLSHRPALFDLQLGDLIADSPDHNGGMIAIAQHHRRYISLPPFIKIAAIVKLNLVRLPGIERFVQYQQPEPVASVQKCWRWRVVSCSYGIMSGSFQQLYLSLLRAIESCRSQRSVVVVNATPG